MKRVLFFLAAIALTVTLAGCNVTVIRRPTPVHIHTQPRVVYQPTHTIIHRPHSLRTEIRYRSGRTRSVYRSSYANRVMRWRRCYE